MSKKKLFKISAACAGMLAGLGLLAGSKIANATVTILGSNGTDNFKLQGCGGGCYYLAAYEYYGNKEGVIVGNYLDNENPLVIMFTLGKKYNETETVSVILKGAKFIAPGNIDSNAAQYCLYNGTTVVATQIGATSYPTDTIFFQFNHDVASGTTLTLTLCNSTNNTVNYVGGNSMIQLDSTNNTVNYVGGNPMIQLDPNLGASCTEPARVKIKWTAAGDCCEATLLQIQARQAAHAGVSNWNFNVELDADRDFTTFLGNGTLLDLCCKRRESNYGCGYQLCTYQERSSQESYQERSSQECEAWVLGANFNPTKGNILKVSFGIQSLNPEPGVKEIRLEIPKNSGNYVKCTKQSDTYWTCTSDCIPCPTCQAAGFEVELDNATSNYPTLWSIVNAKITDICPTDPKVKAVCCVIDEGYAGAWYGGLEAIVPFMRYDSSAGYTTTIKFINRYSKPVKVYAQPFKGATQPIILATKQIGEIPADGGVLMIKAADLASQFPDANFKDGTSVKFLLMVPSQSGCININDNLGCYNNPGDPYVEGYVVYDTPQGSRTVPLKYKYWKQGGYNE